VASKGNHNNERGSQPTWTDVTATLRALEACYGGHVEVCFDVEGTGGASGAMWVYAKLYRGFRVVEERPVDVVRSVWPTAACREMPSLVFRLLHQLDHCADARLRAERSERA